MDAARGLEEQLGAPPPPGLLERLSEAEVERLAETIRRARREQSQALERAGEEALDHVPRLLRPAVRKAVGL